MIWKQNFTVEALNATGANALPEHLGIEILEVGDDYLTARMPVDHRTVQPYRILHGGASVVLAETLGSIASMICLEDVERQGAVGVEINANHLRPAREGEWVYGKVEPIKVGRRLHVWQITIRNAADKKVCVSRLTVAVVDR
ncbi:MAG: hotdog fold thioesterase [Bacteroidota bacterium]